MPFHRLSVTVPDLLSIALCALFLIQPGLDRAAVLRWLIENVYGSLENLGNWGLFSFHKSFEWGVMGFYWLLYCLAIPAIERLKVYPTPWPWKDPDAAKRAEFRDLNRKALFYIMKYHSVVFVITWLLTLLPKTAASLDNYRPETVPAWYVSAFQIIVSSLIAETGFYFGHRLLHSSPFWYDFHKMHHEFKDSTVLATFYLTPVNSLITDLIPAGAGLVLFNMHIYTQWMFTIPLILNAAWVHCGYQFPWRINPFLVLPFSTESEITHDLHHRSPLCNYGGAYFFWDRLLGTYTDPEKHDNFLRSQGVNAKDE
jgi:sterol desaturase/sphingolipid hydroxylase (fatty acid hydroxylase superfamily)